MKDSDNSDNPVKSENRTIPETRAKLPDDGARSVVGRSLLRFALIAVYIGFLAAIVLGLLAGIEYYAYLKIKASPMGQAYKGRDLTLARRSSQQVSPLFGYEPTPGFAAVRNVKLGNAYEYINDESFKDVADVPLEKPKDEYRVFVTGGSVIYGRGPVPPADRVADFYEVTFRWTIPHIMQELLNADPRVREKIGGKRVRVINAGVAGHVIQHDLRRYLGKLRVYKPDMVVSLDGANEVHTVARPLKDWNYFKEGPYYDVITDVMDMGPKGLLNYMALWLKRNTYFFSWLATKKGEGTGIIMEDRGFTALPQDPTPEMMDALKRNINQVADTLAIYHATLTVDKVPHVLALQPMFRNSKKKRTPMEHEIERVTGMDKIGFFYAKDVYDRLVKRVKDRGHEAGLNVLDLTTIFDPVTEWVFTDWCHVTNGGNYLLAKALVNSVKTDVFGLTLLPSDKLSEPLDAYFTDYAKEATVMIDGKASNAGVRILKGYPGEDLLDVPAGPKTASHGLVMDMGKVVPVSRLRIVWGDKQSVPKSWRLELSDDGKEWKKWLDVADTKADHYDQWPGFEYYAAEEGKGRYVKYVQTGESENKPIKLRQLSLFK